MEMNRNPQNTIFKYIPIVAFIMFVPYIACQIHIYQFVELQFISYPGTCTHIHLYQSILRHIWLIPFSVITMITQVMLKHDIYVLKNSS